jgi:hypothetical protein
MPTTYTPIATQTLGSATSTVTFSSIPQTYTDLVLVISGRCSSTVGNNNSAIRFNSDSGNNYSMTRATGDGSTPGTDRVANTSYAGWAFIANSSSSEFSPVIYQIQNYSNTTTNKSLIGRGNWTAQFVSATVSMWRNTAAITTIDITQTGTNWVVGSTFTLYGIKAA